MTIIGWSIVGIAFLWSMVFKDEIYDFFADIKKKRDSKRRGGLKDKLDASLAAQWMSARQVQALIEENKELSNRLNLMHIENSKLQEENSKLVVLARGTLDVDDPLPFPHIDYWSSREPGEMTDTPKDHLIKND